MMRWAVLSAAVLCFLPVCSTGEGERYRDAREGFSLAIPLGWETLPGTAGEAVVFAGPAEAGLPGASRPRIAVRVEPLADGIDLEEYSLRILEGGASAYPGFQATELSRVALETGEAHRIVFSWTDRETPLQAVAYLVVGNGKGYRITGSAAPAAFAGHRAAFEGTARGFCLPGP